jgi:TolA-binding protein
MQRNQFGFNVFLRKCLILVALATASHAYTAHTKATSDAEAFLIRRIAEFWKDGDYAIVKAQIHEFIKKYPSSTLKDYLNGILADLLLQENQYEQALTVYSTITDSAVHEKIILNKLQCYYELNKYSALLQEGERYLTNHSPEFVERKNEFHFIMAESYFRHSLTLTEGKEQAALITKAQPIYEMLMQTEYGDVSSFALAEIYRILKQNVKGVDLYLTLAEKHPSKREGLLFNAALLEATVDKRSAIEIFDRVIALNGNKAGDASFNRLLLYFQTQQFESVISQHRLVYPYVPNDQLPAYNFIVGKSFYNLEDYEHATVPLEKYILEQTIASDQYKDALLIQMTCAKQTNNEALFEKTLTRFKTTYPSDPELAKAHFMHAMVLKKEGQLDKVEQKLSLIFEQYPNFEDTESLLYEYAIATHQNGNYQVSYKILQRFLKDCPDSERKQSVWRYFLSCCLHLSKSSDTSPSAYTKSLFLRDLQKVLSSNSGLSTDEIREYRLLYSKLAYELSSYHDSFEHLNQYIQDYPNHTSLAEAHLLIALNLNKLNADPENFCVHLEQALALNPELYNTSSIQLQLYNAYLVRARNSTDATAFTEKAAHYLYTALQDASQTVKLENQLWLAGYYYALSRNYLDEHWAHSPADNTTIALQVNRSLEIYDRVLNAHKNSLKIIDAQNLYLEAEMLKFAELTGLNGQHEKKAIILQSLIEQQNRHPDWHWQFKRQSLFELAKTYEHLNNAQAALETYQFINEFPSVATPITTSSAFKSAKLQFDLIDKKNKNEKNPDIVLILNQLKDVQIRKNVLSEPNHLEAGLEYAKIRTSLALDSTKDSRYLFFLVRLKEDFTSSEDSIGSEYLAGLKKNAFQENLYTAYMKFIDAEILRMQAKLLYNDNKKEEGSQYKQKALALLAEIEKNKVPTEYLHHEITKSMKLLR